MQCLSISFPTLSLLQDAMSSTSFPFSLRDQASNGVSLMLLKNASVFAHLHVSSTCVHHSKSVNFTNLLFTQVFSNRNVLENLRERLRDPFGFAQRNGLEVDVLISFKSLVLAGCFVCFSLTPLSTLSLSLSLLTSALSLSSLTQEGGIQSILDPIGFWSGLLDDMTPMLLEGDLLKEANGVFTSDITIT